VRLAPVLIAACAAAATLALAGCGTGGYVSGGSQGAGKQLFVDRCGGCHTLADAGTSGAVGPNLDDAKPSQELVTDRVTNGKGQMPSFKGSLDAAQIQAVAEYVSSAAGK
jgi:mono/diheme cytochrome c family protein